MPMFAAPFNPLNVTFCYEFHTSRSLPNMWFLYCLIVIQLITLQLINKSAIVSSIGRPFRPLLRSEEQDGGPSASGGHLGWPHSRFRKWGHPRWPPEAEGPPSCSSLLDRGRKGRPRSWLTSFPAPPSWNQDGGATSNVWWTLGLPWNPQRGVVLVQKTSRRRLTLLRFEKHLIVSLPQPFSKWLRELPACHYGEVDQSARVNTTFYETWCWLRQAPTLHFIFLFYFFFNFFNCTLQYMQIIVEYIVIVGRSLVWLETNLNPTMTILLFSSILSTKRQWQSSTNSRPVWQC